VISIYDHKIEADGTETELIASKGGLWCDYRADYAISVIVHGVAC
jgi:hypothetical protein